MNEAKKEKAAQSTKGFVVFPFLRFIFNQNAVVVWGEG